MQINEFIDFNNKKLFLATLNINNDVYHIFYHFFRMFVKTQKITLYQYIKIEIFSIFNNKQNFVNNIHCRCALIQQSLIIFVVFNNFCIVYVSAYFSIDNIEFVR